MIYKKCRKITYAPLAVPCPNHPLLLNIPVLLDILDAHDDNERVGDKRRLSEGNNTETQPRKRVKKSDGSHGTSTTHNEMWTNAFAIPTRPDAIAHVELVPLYHLTTTIHFSDTPSTDLPEDKRAPWAEQKKRLSTCLEKATAHLTEPRIIALGEARQEEHDRAAIPLYTAFSVGDDSQCILRLYSHHERIRTERAPGSRAWFDAAKLSVLEGQGIISQRKQLQVTLLPSTSVEPGCIPMSLELVSNVGINPTKVGAPPPGKSGAKTHPRQLLTEFVGWFLDQDEVSLPEQDTDIPFFYSILNAAPPSPHAHALQPAALGAALLPFQKRSVAWLLHRELKHASSADAGPGQIIQRRGDLLPFWKEVYCGNGSVFFNMFSGTLELERSKVHESSMGAILAEEPGLGKTMETIALMTLNKAPVTRGPTNTYFDKEVNVDVAEVQTTLIVTPPALAVQWKEELAKHAPTLKVYMYQGYEKLEVPITKDDVEALKKKRKMKSKKNSKAREDPVDEDEEEEVLEWVHFINQFDVCIVNYDVLRGDLYVARPPPSRPRRTDVIYRNLSRPRSPLVSVEWFRVVMDEVQMAKGTKTEEMVSLLPRLSSLAVSGTPARSQIADLLHVFRFLRVEGIESTRAWNQLLKPQYQHFFIELCQRYAIRTMKSAVKDELTIPKQTRYVVGIRMNAIERQVYDQTLDQLLEMLGLDARGVAATENWEVDPVLLRSMIRRLRGICTHPQVGQLQNTVGKMSKPGKLKSMSDVLQDMKEQTWKDLMEASRQKVQSQTKLAQLLLQSQRNHKGRMAALEQLLFVEKDARALIDEIQVPIDEVNKLLNGLRSGTSTPTSDDVDVESDDEEQLITAKGKGKARALEIDLDADGIDPDNADKAKIKEAVSKRGALRTRLREIRVLLHHVKFLQGDAYNSLGAGKQVEEEEAYGAADGIRRQLLIVHEQAAQRAMEQLTEHAQASKISLESLQLKSPLFDPDPKHAKSFPVDLDERLEEADDFIEVVLNKQSAVLTEWRGQIIALLVEKMTPGDDEADGQEYQRALDSQVEAEARMQAYTALLADRKECLINERTLLAAHDAREKHLRNTRAAAKAAQALDNFGIEITEDAKTEQETLLLGLNMERKALVQAMNGRALKSIQVGMNSAVNSMRKNSAKEYAQELVAQLRELISTQEEMNAILEADLARIRKAFNERVQYFAQLQEISDSVADPEIEGRTDDAIEGCRAELVVLSAFINERRARYRYLSNLSGSNQTGKAAQEEETCILCCCEFRRGYITQCAHSFCEVCLKLWVKRKDGKTCPVCRSPIDPADIRRFSIDAPEPEEEPAKTTKKSIASATGETAPVSRRSVEYNSIDAKTLKSIQEQPVDGSFSEKIQTLVQHLLYIQEQEQEAKSIIFSAWADSLRIVEYALKINGLKSIRVDQNRKNPNAAQQFAQDPTLSVLLLHGEKENAGLNVTCASRVFLLESVVHHGFEIQAIARIDRMGQTRPTEVYCYYAEDTIEKNILDLAARTGVSLYTKQNASGIMNVTELDKVGTGTKKNIDAHGKNQKGDFIFKVDDMLAILFPHMYEDVEFLVPNEQEAVFESMDDVIMEEVEPESSNSVNAHRWAGGDNAVAGSSRLG